MKGKVKFFDNKRGYGFITPEKEDMKDVFVHFSQIQGEGYKTLENGQKVVFDAEPSEKGMVAKNVVKL